MVRPALWQTVIRHRAIGCWSILRQATMLIACLPQLLGGALVAERAGLLQTDTAARPAAEWLRGVSQPLAGRGERLRSQNRLVVGRHTGLGYEPRAWQPAGVCGPLARIGAIQRACRVHRRGVVAWKGLAAKHHGQ